jgi:hypothetical protein
LYSVFARESLTQPVASNLGIVVNDSRVARSRRNSLWIRRSEIALTAQPKN